MASNRVGSVFLGDIQRHRNLATSSTPTPPSSPPGTATTTAHPPIVIDTTHSTTTIDMSDSEEVSDLVSGSEEEEEEEETGSEEEEIPEASKRTTLPAPPPPTRPIDPVLAIELRLRWLEAVVLGSKQQQESHRRRSGGRMSIDKAAVGEAATLVKLVESLQARLTQAVQGHDSMKKFIDKYDQHADLLTPSFALSGLLSEPPTYDTLSPEEIDALLIEMEGDIRSADRDMREINELDRKGVLGAGKLPDYEILEPRLKKVAQGYEEDLRLLHSLEGRVASLMQRHASYIDTLSELFVAWDETLSEAEEKVAEYERERAEKLRLGLAV